MNESETRKTDHIILQLQAASNLATVLRERLQSVRKLTHDYGLWRSHGIGNAGDSAEALEREIEGVIRGIENDARIS